jgi:hypothetical protein
VLGLPTGSQEENKTGGAVTPPEAVVAKPYRI